jgi:hypothetical protein
MLVPIVIFLGCFAGGVLAVARQLPDLAPGPVGGMAFFAVAGLVGAALGIVGLHAYEIAQQLDNQVIVRLEGAKSEILATGLLEILRDAGTLFGLAAIVYLLAPAPDDEPAKDAPAASPSQAR